MAGSLARRIDGIPVVASTTERDRLFPSPQRDQRVQIRDGEEQRWTGTAWHSSPAFFAAQRAQGVHWVTDPTYATSGATDTEAWQAALDAGDEIVVPYRSTDYTITNLTISSSKRIRLHGNVTHAASGAMITAAGTTGSTYTASGAAAKGAETFELVSAAGLSEGDYLSIQEGSPALGGVYRVVTLSGTTVTPDRPLDFAITTSAVITEITPITVSVVGDHRTRVTLSNDVPKLFSGSYLLNSEIRGLRLNCTGAASSASATVCDLIYCSTSHGVTIADNEIVGLTGGSEYRLIGVDYSSLARVERNTAHDITGMCRGIEVRYSSGVSATGNKLARVPGSGVGVLFAYYCANFAIQQNEVYGAVYNGVNTSGSGIQVSGSRHGVISGNTVTDSYGPGGIYVSESSQTVLIVGNRLSNDTTGTSQHLAAIMLRSGSDITVVGNHINYTSAYRCIWVRGVDGFLVASNHGVTTSASALTLSKAGSDAEDAAYYPNDGLVVGNRLKATSSTDGFTALSVGTLASNITIRDNEFELTSTATGATTKTALSVAGTLITVKDNRFVLAFDASASNRYLVSWTSGSSGTFSDNDVRYTNADVLISAAGTGWRGERNRLVNTGGSTHYLAGLRDGAVVYFNEKAATALKYGTTANRPTLSSADAGFTYYDTDLSTLMVWSGSAWV